VSWIAAGDRGRYFVCANPHSFQVARHDQRFARAIREADLVVPDGAGIVLASRLLGGAIRARVTGTDLFAGVSARLDAEGGRSCFFLGSTRENLEHLRRRMAETYPRIRIAGCHAPPFKPAFDAEDGARMLRAVNAARPDVLWVGMTAPKQEVWIAENRARLQVKFAGAVGAVFDFYIGRIKRSPPFFLEHGLEWLPRLLQEPRRLWRRMFVSAPLFMWHVVQARTGRRFPLRRKVTTP
jgi:N-acetylglucosaminyldiphosphoundecaprenol N-acetyl-beta-D-mannosaminyltransferase